MRCWKQHQVLKRIPALRVPFGGLGRALAQRRETPAQPDRVRQCLMRALAGCFGVRRRAVPVGQISGGCRAPRPESEARLLSGACLDEGMFPRDRRRHGRGGDGAAGLFKLGRRQGSAVGGLAQFQHANYHGGGGGGHARATIAPNRAPGCSRVRVRPRKASHAPSGGGPDGGAFGEGAPSGRALWGVGSQRSAMAAPGPGDPPNLLVLTLTIGKTVKSADKAPDGAAVRDLIVCGHASFPSAPAPVAYGFVAAVSLRGSGIRPIDADPGG